MTLDQPVGPALRELVERARAVVDGELRSEVESLAARLDAPMRVAVAGRVKAGKSTLVNALLGERLAATEVGERTRVVTWYEPDHRPSVEAVFGDGRAQPVPFRREGGGLWMELDEDAAAREGLAALRVRWPNPVLRRHTLVDTPGLDAIGRDAEDRTRAFLGADDAGERQADAVVYLLRHRRADDASLLEAFHDATLGPADPFSAVAVLSRADELGGGELDAMEVAARVARQHRRSPLLRGLCQTVVPVCGLLAEGAATLTAVDANALVLLAGSPDEVLGRALSSVEDLRREQPGLALAASERDALVRRLGIFGVRVACDALRRGEAVGAADVAGALRRASGIDALTAVLDGELAARTDLAVGRNVVEGLRRVARRAGSDALAYAIESFEASRHEWTELRAVVALRAGVDGVEPDAAAEAERLLGGQGPSLTQRIGSDDDPQVALADAVARWRRRAERPLASPEAVAVAQAVVRSAEGALVSLHQG